MSDRRMFSKKITDSDAFIEMPSATQALYFHLNQSADDDGFNNQIQVAMLKAHAGVDDLKILLAKRFIIRFESGVIVIKHWRIHNTLRKDRYTPTAFQEELAQLGIKDNQSYTLLDGCQAVAEGLPSGCPSIGKVSIGKVSIEKVSIEKDKGTGAKSSRFTPPSLDETPSKFDLFWEAYPKKVGKEAARKSFSKVKAPIETLIEAVERQKLSPQWEKDNGQFIPNPSTWLNQGRWEDEPPEAPKSAASDPNRTAKYVTQGGDEIERMSKILEQMKNQ